MQRSHKWPCPNWAHPTYPGFCNAHNNNNIYQNDFDSIRRLNAEWPTLVNNTTPIFRSVFKISPDCVFVSFRNANTTYVNGSQLAKMKRVFLTYPCHEIYSDKTVGLKNANILEKLWFLWICGICAILWKFDICQLLLNWSSNLKILLQMCDMYNCDNLQHNTFRFNLLDFHLNRVFPSQFCGFFTVKSPSVTQRSVSEENAFKKSKDPSPFSPQIIGWNNSFTLIEYSFRFLW